MRIGKTPALGSKPINVWRLNLGRTIATQIPISQIIGENENNVRLVCLCGIYWLSATRRMKNLFILMLRRDSIEWV